ncbi:hypothetical protein [Polaromonas sp. JS666]|uniref:hypothetical protein n=1 Tax=Polaromonas sp. (strain JS666 / ATCC BAA-500) TaxID=296591 RepID=UPI00087E2694|nr:hypothetical protein [Polaromonas sp. JS666]SDN51619.1 hypothetical protein SAMN05720382_105308 [Polaromonas sp. JS666]
MPHFLLSFRIESDSTYQDRYDSLQEALRTIAAEIPWDETSSVCIFPAAGTAQSVADHLYYKSKLLAPKDLLLIIDLDNRTHAQYGCKYPNSLKANLGF